MELDSTSMLEFSAKVSERVVLKELCQNELLYEGSGEEVRKQQGQGKWKRKLRSAQGIEPSNMEAIKENNPSCGLKSE